MPKDQLKRIIDTKRQVITVRGAGSGNGGGGGGGGGGDLSNYYTKSESDIRFLTPAEGDALFLTPSEGNALYVPLTSTITPGAGLAGTAGLSLASPITLTVGAANGIEVLEDTVGVKLLTPGPSGLTLAAGGLSLAAHDILGSFHTYAGAAWNVVGKNASNAPAYLPSKNDVTSDPKEALLRSNAGGVVQLAGIDIGNSAITPKLAGEVNIYGDLNVTGVGNLPTDTPPGYGGLPVLTVNASGGNIGIMTNNPDPQFALDVAGPVRAQYFIGPHALQIKDAGLISHFDGWEKGIEGEPNAIPLGQKGFLYGYAPFFAGKFGKAIGFGEPSTNYITNPSFETNANGWNAGAYGTGTGVDTSFGFVGSSSYKLVVNGVATAYILNSSVITNVAVGATVYAQCRVFRSNPYGYSYIAIRVSGASVAISAAPNDGTSGGETWEWLWVSWTNNTAAPATVGIMLTAYSPDDSTYTAWYDAVQMELDKMTPYFDGSLNGYNVDYTQSATYAPSWSGTAHGSTSVTNYSGSRVEYDMAGTGMQTGSGAVAFWLFNYSNNASHSSQSFLWSAGAANAELDLIFQLNILRFRVEGGNTIDASWSDAADNRRWVHIAVTWHKGYARMYKDGALVGGGYVNVSGDTEQGVPYTTTTPITLHSRFAMGYRGGGYRFNGLVDDLLIVKRRLTGTEVKAIYESNAPVFAESSVFAFRATPTGLVWADEEGLWMRDVLGNAVLGVYGGAAAKTWGGGPMEMGDLKIGRGGQFVFWDNNGGAGGTGLLTVSGAINIIAGSSGIGNLNDAGALATKDSVDLATGEVTNKVLNNIADGGGFAKTTTNEKTGAARGFLALDTNNRLVTNVRGGAAVTATPPSGSGLYLGSDYLGYYNSTNGWRTYMNSSGQFYLAGASGDGLTWNGTTLDITGNITADAGDIGGWSIQTRGLVGPSSLVGLSGEGWPNGAADNVAIWAGGAYNSAPFRVTNQGKIYASLATFAGGTIGSWVITTTYLYSGDSSNIIGLVSGTGHFTSIWSGDTYLNRQSAPFRVTNQGHLHARYIIHSINTGVITDPGADSLAMMSYSDGLVGVKRYVTFWQPAATTVGVHVGSNLTNGFQITRAEAAASPVYFKNQGTGGMEWYINNLRSMSLANSGQLTAYDSSGNVALGAIVSNGSIRSNAVLGGASVAKFLPYTANILAANEVVSLGATYGFVIITCSSVGDTCLLLLRGTGAPLIVSQTNPGSEFFVLTSANERGYIYVSGGVVNLQNRSTATQRSYHITYLGIQTA